MFIFYCILFSKLSKNKSRKLLVLCLMPLWVYLFITKLLVAHSTIQNNSGGSARSPRGAAPGPHRGRGHVPLKRAIANLKFTVSEEILHFRVMGHRLELGQKMQTYLDLGMNYLFYPRLFKMLLNLTRCYTAIKW